MYSSIFNHSLGPVTLGPSSSNTSGPYRIGLLAHQICGGVPRKVTLDLATSTNYASTFFGSRSDLAIINGLLGKELDYPAFFNAYSEAKSASMMLTFDMHGWTGEGTIKGHRLHITNSLGQQITITADSTGGGTVKIIEIEGCSVDIRGDQYELLIFIDNCNKSFIQPLISDMEREIKFIIAALYIEGKKSHSLIEIKSGEPIREDLINKLIKIPEIYKTLYLKPVHPVVINYKASPPFQSPQEMRGFAEKNKIELWEAAVKYESMISGWTNEQVLEYAKKLWSIIKNSIKLGTEGNFDMHGPITGKAGQLQSKLGEPGMLSMGFLDIAAPVSLSIMEYSNASGRIVCIPTGGASGIVPASIYGAGISLNLKEEELIKALLVAGVLGVCMSDGNNFSGGEFGCQAEVGCGTAMAAGALTHIMGGNPKQICDAASMALQCLMGLVCDPVAGVVQIPCLARNMAGTAVAATCANAVIAGFDPGIPFEEMFTALKEVGRIVCHSHEVGAATTPTGCRMRLEQEERDRRLRCDQ
jgi:L-serine dehydratase